MNKTQKLLRKLRENDRHAIIARMRVLMAGDWHSLDVEKIKGQDDIYRCRVGNFRIIFSFIDGIFVLKEVRRRNESTYKNF